MPRLKIYSNRPGAKNLEFQIPLLYKNPASLLDYLPLHSLVLVDDLSMIESMVSEVEEQAVHFRQESIEEGTLPADFPGSLSNVVRVVRQICRVTLGMSLVIPQNPTSQEGTHSLDFSGIANGLAGILNNSWSTCSMWLEATERVVIVSRQSERLQELWAESSLDLEVDNHPQFSEASLTEGFIFNDLHLITDSEIFGWERPQPRARQKPAAEAPEAMFADLRQGDLVVHIDHGIGRYAGLVQRSLEGHEREFLAVEYEKGDMVFVPVHQADRLTRYIGSDGGNPTLSRLGGADWASTKSRVREAVQQIAEELLDLYARRQVSQGYAFKPDTTWQKELEDSFPYIETDDQAQAIWDIKGDMESPRPMDRLLCGDVGYGKTEVALTGSIQGCHGRQAGGDPGSDHGAGAAAL